MSKIKKITLLGSTGSIGVNTLNVIQSHPHRYRIFALVAGSNIELLAKQIQQFQPKVVVVKEKASAILLKERMHKSRTQIKWGEEEIIAVATDREVDLVLSAIVGAAGLKPTYAALQSGKIVALANKESLVAAGPVMTKALAEGGGSLIPVDSEHSAIHQVLKGSQQEIVRVILTASGGPFRTFSKKELEQVTIEEALKHPNWSMGDKITIDSATMMNKGLEVIEAHWLFQMPLQKIAVLVHPQSIIHSLVEYVDGSVLAQMGNPDMRTPIAYALAYPERISTDVKPLHLSSNGNLTFEEPDPERFPSLLLARNALEMGDSAPCVLNAANEIAVGAFLKKKIQFLEIATIVEKVLSKHKTYPLKTIEDVIEVDRETRRITELIL